MLRTRYFLVGLAILLATFGYSSGRSQTQSQQQTAAPDQRGTELQPLVVQPLPTKKNAEENDRDIREAKEKTDSDWWTWFLSILTVAALFGQATILAAQAYFLRGTLNATAQAAEAAQRQGKIFAAVEGPMPLVPGIKLVQFAQIPGEITLVDPVVGGPIPPNCRIMIGVENKGRTPLRMIELCVEKFAGLSLPPQPTYVHIDPWGLVLEKGPLWIRPSEALTVVTPADVAAAAAAYPAGAFWVFGYFAYWNLLDERTIHKFAARWDLVQGFIPENRPGYT